MRVLGLNSPRRYAPPDRAEEVVVVQSQHASVLVREIGSLHVGGGLLKLTGLPLRQRGSTRGGPVRPVDPNGEIAAGQMYAQYVRLAEPRGRLPVLMWHGGGMSGANWETTPNGRAGWQSACFCAPGWMCLSVIRSSVDARRGRRTQRCMPASLFSGPRRRPGRRRSGSDRLDPGIRTRPTGHAPRTALPGRRFRCVHETGDAAVDDQRRGDPGRL